MRKRRIRLTRVNGRSVKIPVGITQCEYLQPEACAFAWDELLEQQSSLEQVQFFINARWGYMYVQDVAECEQLIQHSTAVILNLNYGYVIMFLSWDVL